MDGQRPMVCVPEGCFTYSVFVCLCVGDESARGFQSYTRTWVQSDIQEGPRYKNVCNEALRQNGGAPVSLPA